MPNLRRARRGLNPAAGLALALAVCGAASPTASAQTTVPALWTAGGLDAGTGGAGQAARMASDAAGNLAVVSGPAGGRDLAVTSYRPDGSLRWRRTVSPASGTFAGDWVATAPDGEVVALGHPVDSGGRPIGITLLRYTSGGTLRWRVDLAPLFPSVARLVVDAAGDAYVAFSGLGDGRDIAVHKYGTAGDLIWAHAVNTGPVTTDIASSLALSPDGADVVVTGTVGATWIVASLDARTGSRRWLVTAPEGPAARDVVVDASRVYVAGQGVTGAGTPAIAYTLTVVAYSRASGTRLWRTDSAPVGSQAAGYRIALAPDGSVVVAGAHSSGGYFDWWTVAFEASGGVRWEARRDRSLTGDEIPSAVLVRDDGTTVVSGLGGPVVRDALGNSYMQGVTAGYGPGAFPLWEAFSRLGTVWMAELPGNDLCATGGYDALVTCWRLSGPASPPAAPSGLTARLSGGSILLAWQDNATDETAFSVERSVYTGSGWTNFSVMATLGADATSYADGPFTAGSYAYRVRASNAIGDSAYSNTASVTIVSANDPPNAVMSATPSSGTAPLEVTFDGSGSTDLGGFVTAWAWTYGDGATGTGVTATHVYSTPGTYLATLTVTDNGGLSSTASTSIVVAPATPPRAPTDLTAAALSRSAIRLQWTNTDANQREVGIARCRGANCTNFVEVAVVEGTATTFTDTGLAARTVYRYRVRARGTAGDSPYSNVASARTLR